MDIDIQPITSINDTKDVDLKLAYRSIWDRDLTELYGVEARVFRNSHDRFVIIDDNIYHFGASIKDLGKKWFAVTLMTEYTADELLHRL